MKYFDEPEHRRWRQHYVQGRNGGFLLAFTEAFKATLPPGSTSNGFLYKMKDTQTGQLYDQKIYVAYENAPRESVLDEDWNLVDVQTVMSYFYGCHHCPCHRKQDMEKYLPEIDSECEGERFLIYGIYPPEQPELNLYSEVLTEEELEAELMKNAPEDAKHV